MIAQKLYESGKITYMRTDSVNLSEDAIISANQEINNLYGQEYAKKRIYNKKTKGAQEAHEAIRPSYMSSRTIDGEVAHKKLYELIWKRTIASQMSDAKIDRTIVKIAVSDASEEFVARGEVIAFEGFMKVYIEDKDSKLTKSCPGVYFTIHTRYVCMVGTK